MTKRAAGKGVNPATGEHPHQGVQDAEFSAGTVLKSTVAGRRKTA